MKLFQWEISTKKFIAIVSTAVVLLAAGITIPIVSILMGLANLCGTGGAPLCSIHRGRGEEEEAERVMGNAFSLLILFGLAAMVFFLAFRRPILYLFGVPQSIRQAKIQKVLRMDYRAIGHRLLKEFPEYVRKINAEHVREEQNKEDKQ